MIVDPKRASDLQKGYRSIPNCSCSEAPITAELREHFRNLFETVEANPKTLLYDCSAYISLVFSCLARNDQLTVKHLNGKTIDFYNRVITYLAEHYPEALTSAGAAEVLFYTQSYFCRVFKKCFGVHFSEYLNTYRLLAAKKKLSTEK